MDFSPFDLVDHVAHAVGKFVSTYDQINAQINRFFTASQRLKQVRAACSKNEDESDIECNLRSVDSILCDLSHHRSQLSHLLFEKNYLVIVQSEALDSISSKSQIYDRFDLRSSDFYTMNKTDLDKKILRFNHQLEDLKRTSQSDLWYEVQSGVYNALAQLENNAVAELIVYKASTYHDKMDAHQNRSWSYPQWANALATLCLILSTVIILSIDCEEKSCFAINASSSAKAKLVLSGIILPVFNIVALGLLFMDENPKHAKALRALCCTWFTPERSKKSSQLNNQQIHRSHAHSMTPHSMQAPNVTDATQEKPQVYVV